jgi:hypothetical protein
VNRSGYEKIVLHKYSAHQTIIIIWMASYFYSRADDIDNFNFMAINILDGRYNCRIQYIMDWVSTRLNLSYFYRCIDHEIEQVSTTL